MEQEKWTEYATLELRDGWPIHGLSFNPDGSRLAMGGELTKEFCIWNLREIRERLASLNLDWDQPAISRITERPAAVQHP